MHLKMLVHWLFTALLWFGSLSSHTLAQAGHVLMQVAQDLSPDYSEGEYADVAFDPDPTATNGPEEKVTKVPVERIFNKLLINRTRPQPCDQQVDLFLLANASNVHIPMNGCSRPFVAHSIPNSNLLLLVVDALCPQEEPRQVHEVTLSPTEVVYNASLSCYKVGPGWDLNRKKPRSCFNHHPKEREIELCGGATSLTAWTFLSIVLSLLVLRIGTCRHLRIIS